MGLYTVTEGATTAPSDINQLVGAVTGTIAPTLLGSTIAATTVTSSSLAINVPTQVQNGCLLVLAISNGQQAPTGGLTGWMSIATSSGASGVTLYTYYRIASNEPASYTVTFGGSTTIAMTMLCYAGITGAPLRTNGNTTGVGGVTTATPPTLTGVTTGDLVLIIAGTRPASPGAYTLTMPHTGGWTSLGNAVATDSTSAAEVGVSALVGGTSTPAVTTSASCEFGIVSVAFITGTDITVNGPISAGLTGGIGTYAITGALSQPSPGAPFTATLPLATQLSASQGGPLFLNGEAIGVGGYVARIHQTVSQTMTTNNQFFSLDTVDFDPRGMVGQVPLTSPPVNGFLIPFPGVYRVVGAVHSSVENKAIPTLSVLQWGVAGATGAVSLVSTSCGPNLTPTATTTTGYTFASTALLNAGWVALIQLYTPSASWSTDVTNSSRTFFSILAQP